MIEEEKHVIIVAMHWDEHNTSCFKFDARYNTDDVIWHTIKQHAKKMKMMGATIYVSYEYTGIQQFWGYLNYLSKTPPPNPALYDDVI